MSLCLEYVPYNPSPASLILIDRCNTILEDYSKQGYSLTLRQLYYQLVAKDIIPNTQKSYNRLGAIVTKAREGGLISWGHIVDRTRNVRSRPHWVTRVSFCGLLRHSTALIGGRVSRCGCSSLSKRKH